MYACFAFVLFFSGSFFLVYLSAVAADPEGDVSFGFICSRFR
jgi:hypothetical protein